MQRPTLPGIAALSMAPAAWAHTGTVGHIHATDLLMLLGALALAGAIVGRLRQRRQPVAAPDQRSQARAR
jgi:hypothetical protein